jgi:hypothetical protein
MEVPPNADTFKTLIESFRNRAKSLRKSGRFKFNLILVALTIAILVFIFAGFLTAKIADDHNNQYLKLEAAADTFSIRYKADLDSMERISNHLYYRFYSGGDSLSRKIDSIIDKAAMKDFSLYGEERIQNLTQMIATLKALESKKSEEQKANNFTVFLTTLSTRIGAILILIFLIQLLIRIYRYDIRIANYYDARADALEIHSKEPGLSFDKIINLVSPDIYDIGNPKSPSDSLLSLLTTIKNMK